MMEKFMKHLKLSLIFLFLSSQAFAYGDNYGGGGGYGDTGQAQGGQWGQQLNGNSSKAIEALQKAYQQRTGKDLEIKRMPNSQGGQNQNDPYGGGGYGGNGNDGYGGYGGGGY